MSNLNVLENRLSSKDQELIELNTQIKQESEKFVQALNSLISEAEDWKSKYILTAPQSGKLIFIGNLVEEGTMINVNQELFFIDPSKNSYFGTMYIPQNNMGKVALGQKVLVKLKSYPFEDFGIIKGKIEYITDVPIRDSLFMSKVAFTINKSRDNKLPIVLKQGMLADAEIVTQDMTVLQRIYRNIIRTTN